MTMNFTTWKCRVCDEFNGGSEFCDRCASLRANNSDLLTIICPPVYTRVFLVGGPPFLTERIGLYLNRVRVHRLMANQGHMYAILEMPYNHVKAFLLNLKGRGVQFMVGMCRNPANIDEGIRLARLDTPEITQESHEYLCEYLYEIEGELVVFEIKTDTYAINTHIL